VQNLKGGFLQMKDIEELIGRIGELVYMEITEYRKF